MPDPLPPGVLHGVRLLVVEDDYLLADQLRRELVVAGAEVVGPAPTVARAVHLIEQGAELDGAILDVNLGGEMIFPLVDLLRERRIPFVFATGYNPEALPAAYAHVPSCVKPVGSKRLARALGLM